MAWEIAKGILLAVFILCIVVPIALALLSICGVVGVLTFKTIFEGLKSLPAAARRTLKAPATLKLTPSSKGLVLPFSNRQAALVVGIFAVVVFVVVAVSLSHP
jgi:hypothetical protein